MSMIAPFSKVVNDILFLSDLHAPYQHRDAVSFIHALVQAIRPQIVASTGDLFDQHSWSRFTQHPSLYGAGHEWAAAMDVARTLEKFIPKMKIATGNHDTRYQKRAVELGGLPPNLVRSLPELVPIKGWTWAPSHELATTAGPVTIEHGEQRVDELRRAGEIGTNLVCGHQHSIFRLQHFNSKRRLYWAMRIGCLIDIEQYSYLYGRVLPMQPIIGCGALIKGEPRLIRMGLKKSGRWDGKILV